MKNIHSIKELKSKYIKLKSKLLELGAIEQHTNPCICSPDTISGKHWFSNNVEVFDIPKFEDSSFQERLMRFGREVKSLDLGFPDDSDQIYSMVTDSLLSEKTDVAKNMINRMEQTLKIMEDEKLTRTNNK